MKLSFYRKTGEKRSYNILQPPTGTIVAYAGSSAPTGWLVCSGGVVSSSAYPALSDVIKTNFNTSGEGAGNFRLPDLRERAPIGAGTGTGLTARTLGAKIGNISELLTGQQSGIVAHTHPITEDNHTHSVAADSHSHTYTYEIQGQPQGKSGGTSVGYAVNAGGGVGLISTGGPSSVTFTIEKKTSNITDGSGNSNVVGYKGDINAVAYHANVQPSLVVNYIIKT